MAADQPLGEDGRWLAGEIVAYLAQPIEIPALEKRDMAFRDLGGALVPDGTAAAKVDAIRTEMRRYLARWLREDRDRAAPPATYSDPRALLFEIYRLSDGNPPNSPKQLRRILLSHWQDKRTSGQLFMSIERGDSSGN